MQLIRILLARLRRARTVGGRGERVAARHMKRSGYRILGRNVRSAAGEIDLIAQPRDGRAVVIVEVKAGVAGRVPPEAHVDAAKRRKLAAVAAQVVRQRGWARRPIRFDVIAVVFEDDGPPTVRHHVGAFETSM